MTVVNRPSKQLHKTIHIEYTSYVNDKPYIGDFVVKKLTIRDISALGVRKAQLNGGMHYSESHHGQGVDEATDEINGMIAHLELAIVSAPAWWKMDEIPDTDLLVTLYREVLDFENSFLRRKLEASQQTAATARLREEGSSGTVDAPNDAGANRAVVQADIQAALEP
jgi:hypothetical protein